MLSTSSVEVVSIHSEIFLACRPNFLFRLLHHHLVAPCISLRQAFHSEEQKQHTSDVLAFYSARQKLVVI